jgi:hypothetical protein
MDARRQSAGDGNATLAYVVEHVEAPDGTSKRRVRARTVSMMRYAKRDLAAGAQEFPPSIQAEHQRPRTRDDCLPGGCNEQRPCPWVSCGYHLYLDTNDRTRSIKLNFPDREVGELAETCSLDVADRGGQTLEETAEHTNITRERSRQIEQRALAALAAILSDAGITAADLADATPETDPRHMLGHLGARGVR